MKLLIDQFFLSSKLYRKVGNDIHNYRLQVSMIPDELRCKQVQLEVMICLV